MQTVSKGLLNNTPRPSPTKAWPIRLGRAWLGLLGLNRAWLGQVRLGQGVLFGGPPLVQLSQICSYR